MEAASVRESLKTWQDNYIHVQGVMDEFVSLRERTKYLRDEVRNNFLFCRTILSYITFCASPSGQVTVGTTGNYEYKLISLHVAGN